MARTRGIRNLPRDLEGLVNATNERFARQLSEVATDILADYIHNTPVKTGFMQSQWDLDSSVIGDSAKILFSNSTFYFYRVYHFSRHNKFFPDIVTDSIPERVANAIEHLRAEDVILRTQFGSGIFNRYTDNGWKRWLRFAEGLGPVVGDISTPSVEARNSPQQLLGRFI